MLIMLIVVRRLPVEMRILEIWRQSLLDTHNKAL